MAGGESGNTKTKQEIKEKTEKDTEQL